jgi:acyl-CoA synthetase (AMP-forming)/AMP-acid ligase II
LPFRLFDPRDFRDEGVFCRRGGVAQTPQVALGYWRDPERTSQAFKDMIIDGKAVRPCCSGDWAERRGQHIYFKERVDFQVKIRGYCIELDEVAAAIREAGWPVCASSNTRKRWRPPCGDRAV